MAVLTHTEYTSQKKELLEGSLLNLMIQTSYPDISVTDICRKANVPRRTFYHYFASKDDVLESMIEALIQQFLLHANIDTYLRNGDVEQGFIEILGFWIGDNRQKLDVLLKNGLESRLISCASRWSREMHIGYIQNSDLPPKIVEITLLIGATDFFTLLFYWSRNEYQESLEEMAKYATWVLPHPFYNLANQV